MLALALKFSSISSFVGITLIVTLLAVWIGAIFHCLLNKSLSRPDKKSWLLIILCLLWIGTVAYVFSVRADRRNRS